jgi:hypothetical protein
MRRNAGVSGISGARDPPVGRQQIAVLINPAGTDAQGRLTEIHEAARIPGRRIAVVEARNEGDIEHALATICRSCSRPGPIW